MKKGAGLAILVLASIYKANKKKKSNNSQVNGSAIASIFGKPKIAKQNAPIEHIEVIEAEQEKRKSPVQILKEAELRKQSELGKQKEHKLEEPKIDVPVNIPEDPEEKESQVSEKTSTIEDMQVAQEDAIMSQTEIVYMVGKGKKYHLSKECRGVKADSVITELTLEDAINKGYSLCGWENK